MAQRVAAALTRGDTAREQALAEQRIADAGDFAIWSGFVSKMWSQPSEHRLFAFENVEHILGSVERVDFLARLLAHLPAERQIAICSRQPLPLSLSRFVAPHELITLRENALQFDAVDIRAAFANLDVGPEALDEVAHISRGWPVAVLLLARLAREGALAPALKGSSGLAFADLYDYLAEQVFESLGAPQFARLLAVAAIPHASGEEVALVLGDPRAAGELAAVARSSPFVYRVMDGAYEAHPLMRTMLHERYGDRCRQMLLQAAARLAAIRPLRAAQLYLEAGDDDHAALLLECQFELFVSEIPPLFAEIVSRLDEGVVLRHAGLWAAATVVRSGAIPQRQWLYEALTARDQITPATPLSTRVGVFTSLGNVLTNLGRHDEALECFQQFVPAGVELPQRYRGIQLLFRSAVAARRGRFNDAIALWSEAEPLFAEVSFTRAIALEEIVARAARFAQSREAERTLLDRAIALARDSGAATVRALALQEAFFGAWLAGEDALAGRYAHELEDGVSPSTAKATELLRASIRGDLELLRRNEGFERPRFRHYAALIACATVADEMRPEFARLALEAAEDAGDATCIAIASIACMECRAPAERAALAEGVRAQCATVDAPRLRRAVDAYLSGGGDLGLLTPLIGRLRGLRSEPAAAAASPFVISIADGSVRRNGSAIRLSNRERELLLYLALHRRACSRDELIGAIWPGREGNARSVVRVYASRLRARLGDASVVQLLDSGEYRLSSDTRIDFYDIERLVQASRSQPLLATETRARLEAYSRRWSGDAPPRLKMREWFTAFVPRIEELSRQITLLLGYDSLELGRFGEARRMAERIIALDRCDEPAWELLIRAMLAAGDAVGARRELRKYREALAAELGAEPSSDLERLVTDMQPGRRPVTGP
ncbi:hypothetical protein EPN44_07785 [bacterium]|nr:MAG: hypothetical protein EPN44_07785 [bacterium]